MADLFRIFHERPEHADGRLGPAARLGATTRALNVRGPGRGIVTDGPFAETKEHLLGLYVVDCETREAAVEVARDLQRRPTPAPPTRSARSCSIFPASRFQ